MSYWVQETNLKLIENIKKLYLFFRKKGFSDKEIDKLYSGYYTVKLSSDPGSKFSIITTSGYAEKMQKQVYPSCPGQEEYENLENDPSRLYSILNQINDELNFAFFQEIIFKQVEDVASLNHIDFNRSVVRNSYLSDIWSVIKNKISLNLR